MKSTIMLDEVAFNYNKLWQFICYNVRQLWLTMAVMVNWDNNRHNRWKFWELLQTEAKQLPLSVDATLFIKSHLVYIKIKK